MNWTKKAPGWWETDDGRGLVTGRDDYFTLHWRPGPHRRIWQEVTTRTGKSAYRRSLAAAQKAVEAKLAAIDEHLARKEAA